MKTKSTAVAVIEMLISHGADVNAVTGPLTFSKIPAYREAVGREGDQNCVSGVSALHLALLCENYDAARLLISNGAKQIRISIESTPNYNLPAVLDGKKAKPNSSSSASDSDKDIPNDITDEFDDIYQYDISDDLISVDCFDDDDDFDVEPAVTDEEKEADNALVENHIAEIKANLTPAERKKHVFNLLRGYLLTVSARLDARTSEFKKVYNHLQAFIECERKGKLAEEMDDLMQQAIHILREVSKLEDDDENAQNLLQKVNEVLLKADVSEEAEDDNANGNEEESVYIRYESRQAGSRPEYDSLDVTESDMLYLPTTKLRYLVSNKIIYIYIAYIMDMVF
jgi:hypothetical protein